MDKLAKVSALKSPYRNYTHQVVFYDQGKRKKKFFNSKPQANLFADKSNAALRNNSKSVGRLNPDEEIAMLIWRSSGTSLSLSEVVKDALAKEKAHNSSSTLQCTIDRFIDDKEVTGIGKRQLDTLNSHASKILDHFGADTRLSDITTDSINDWLKTLKTVVGKKASMQTKINHRATLHNMLSYAVKNNLVSTNHCTHAIQFRVNKKDVEYYDVRDVTKLISKADRQQKLTLVLSAFCGLRSSEATKVNWSQIDLSRGYLRVDKATKTGTRLVRIPENALEYLKRVNGKGKVLTLTESQYKTSQSRLFAQSGVTKVTNGYRHSFGTYYQANFEDWVATSNQMGNSVSVCKEHYVDVIPKEDGIDYFSLNLTNDQQRVNMVLPPFFAALHVGA